MRYLPVKGNLSVTLLHFEGADGGGQQSISFANGFQIPQLRFPGGKTLKFFLRVREEEVRNDLTGTLEIKREGELSFNAFLPGDEKSYRNGSESFFLHPNQREQKFKWDNIAIKHYSQGRVGALAVELSFTILS